MERLETDRLVLRAISLDDVDELVALDSDPEVMRYLTGGRPSSRDEVEATVREELGSRWMAFRSDTGEFVGWFGLHASTGGEYELGYRVRREQWGNGFATEGTLALVGLAFGALRAQRVFAQTMAVNAPSRRVMERCGLRYVRTFHLEWDDPIDGTELGEVEYALERGDWLGAASPER